MKMISQTPETLNLKPGTLNLVLSRTFTRGEYTHGSLSIDGTKICSTLENANALVPSGNYQITLIKCKQYARKMLCLNPNASCTKCKRSLNSQPSSLNLTLPCWCPMIKPGNGVHKRLDGSILVGQYNCLGSIIHPKTVFDPLYERIRKSIRRGHQVTLIIKDN